MTGVRVGIDVGGTFTDAALVADDGRMVIAKVRSTPGDPSQGFAHALDELTARAGVPAEAIEYLAHGTTVATNAMVQGRLARAGLVTTRGFRDLLAIGTQMRRHVYDLWTPEPEPVIPRERCVEVAGRLAADGAELEPVDADDVRRAAAALDGAGVEAVAVCLLHAYANPAHEREVGRLLAAALPGVPVTLSCDVAPEYREYVRASTTATNAALLPVAGAYVARLAAAAAERGIAAPVHLMQSNGGVARADRAASLPVALAASGPSASVVGAARLAAEVGRADVLTFDMGGTTTDVALVVGGVPALRPAGEYEGRPLNVPQVDVVSIGAGGGSIARVEAGGRLRVGPESAGAEPGPAAYGAGGEDATVTDAHAVLGTIRAGVIAGGVVLDRDAACAALQARVAGPLGLGLEEAAEAVVRVADANMAGALRLVSVARGRDPRRFALVAAGGAGGLHACGVAEVLGVIAVVVPRYPGIAAALGLLVSDERHEVRRSLLREVDRLDAGELAGLVDELAADARELLATAPGGAVGLAADFRYRGQAYNLTVPLAGGTRDDVTAAVAAFAALHEETYGFALPASDVELVTVRARGVRTVAAALPAPPAVLAAPPSARAVRLDGVTREVPVLERSALGEGVRVEGPAIVEQEDATTVVRPGWAGAVGAGGTLVLERA